jgi:folate-binding protein YgfZ
MSDPVTTPTLVGPGLSAGAVRLSGRDVLAVLHNISTQSLLDLAPGQARLALFCDFRGRLLHRVHAARVSDGSTWLVREDRGGASLAALLERVVFREDVRIEDLSASLGVTPEFGEPSGAASSGGPKPAPGDRSDGLGTVLDHDGRPTRIEIPGCPAFSISDSPALVAPDAARWNGERIDRGWAAHGHEVSEAFTPFDVNLGHGLHLDKGCFTGQETLMRLVTYGSLRRRLIRVRGAGASPTERSLLDLDGAEVATLTSAAESGSGWVALAVAKQAGAPEGRALQTAGGRRLLVERVFPFAQPAGRALRES